LAIKVGVFGATGYTGRELIRLLRRHPKATVEFTTGSGGGHLPHESGLAHAADAHFLCLPHGVAATYVARLQESQPNARIIDLSGDLRLPTADEYKHWYATEHPAPHLLGKVPYGLCEIYRERLRGARIISNPGCYATSMLLPLIPLLRQGLIAKEDIIVDAKSGASGAGRALREDLLFCEVLGNFWAYSPGRTHRHVGEVEWILEDSANCETKLTFCPHLLPVRRGILSAIYVKALKPAEALSQALRAFYAGSPFVRVVDKPPRPSHVARTNNCLMSIHPTVGDRVVIFSVIDNLMKGAAGQAVQNLNLAFELEEAAGLPSEEIA
jgi:N-acetyl-gamma-glutamyl-phosphate reductase